MSDNDKPPTCGSTDGERWLPVAGYEGLYAVSDHGRVWSAARLDQIGRRKNGRVLAQQAIGQYSKHWSVTLYRGNPGVPTRLLVHRLMAFAFLGPEPFPGAMVRHLNDNPNDNAIENLAWGTGSENQADAVRNGRNYWSSRTHCQRGHDYAVSFRWKRSDNARACSACGSATGRVGNTPRWAPLVDEIANACYRKILAKDHSRMTTEKLMERYG